MLVHVMDQRELAKGEGPIALILAPTRELAEQIHREARKFSKPYGVCVCVCVGGVCVCGGGALWRPRAALSCVERLQAVAAAAAAAAVAAAATHAGGARGGGRGARRSAHSFSLHARARFTAWRLPRQACVSSRRLAACPSLTSSRSSKQVCACEVP
jgi:hypothetical protein